MTWQRHQENVADLSFEIAKRLKLDAKYCIKIRDAALIHDEGKVFLDPKILYKRGKLTGEEFNYVKRHVYYSAKIAIEKNLDIDIIDMILLHHENFNGSGYLVGLKGAEIPIGARILRVADYFIALTEKRIYKSDYTSSEAIEIMEEDREVFDTQIFQLLKGMINKSRGLFKNYKCINSSIEMDVRFYEG